MPVPSAADALATLQQRHGYNRGRSMAFAVAASRLAFLVDSFEQVDLTDLYAQLQDLAKQMRDAAQHSHEAGDETQARLDAIRDLAQRQAP